MFNNIRQRIKKFIIYEKLLFILINSILMFSFLFIKKEKNCDKNEYINCYYIGEFFIPKELNDNNNNYFCKKYISLNNNFNFEKDNYIDLLLFNIMKTRIENIMILFGVMKLLKTNSTIIYKITNKEIYKIFRKNIFSYKKIYSKIIIINSKEYFNLFKNIKKIIYYQWEIIPKKQIINNARHIINTYYYNEYILEIFDKALNLNLKNFINDNLYNLTFNDIEELMSKNYNIIFK